MSGRLIVLIIVLAAAAVASLVYRDRLAALDQTDLARIVYALMALALVAGGYFASRSRALSAHWLRDALIWVSIVFALALGYSFVVG